MKNEQFKYYNIRRIKDNIDISRERVIIWGMGETSLYVLVDLVSAGITVIGFTDSFVHNTTDKRFAGYPIYMAPDIKDMGDIVICVATYNTDYITDILYKIYELGIKNANIVCLAHAAKAKEYDVSWMNSLGNEDIEKIDYVNKTLADEKSKKVFDLLLLYRKTNNRKYLKEAFDDSHRQYFPTDDIFLINDNEIFIDAGGYDGSTTIDFYNWSGNNYKKSYILEADETLFNVCKEKIKLRHIPNTEILNKAAYYKTGYVSFDASNFDTGSAMISDDGRKVETITIDEMLNGSEATYIKMDIEGGEMDALLGAKKTIHTFRPKLAISIYHWDDDLWKIPFYLMSEYPFYKFYIRHYTKITAETILYASIDR